MDAFVSREALWHLTIVYYWVSMNRGWTVITPARNRLCKRDLPDEKDVRKEAAATVPWAYFPSVRERECRASHCCREWNVRDMHTRATNERKTSYQNRTVWQIPFCFKNRIDSFRFDLRAPPYLPSVLPALCRKQCRVQWRPTVSVNRWNDSWRSDIALSRVIVSRTIHLFSFWRGKFFYKRKIDRTDRKRRNKVATAVFIRTVVTARRLYFARVHNIAHRMHLARMPQPVGEIWVIDDGVVENTSHLASHRYTMPNGEVIVDRGCASANIYLATSTSIVILLPLPNTNRYIC